MAEIGLIASTIGIIGFAGQVTQGCLFLKTLLSKVKDGPSELGALWRELELVNTTVEDLEGLWNRLKDSIYAVSDPWASLRNCDEAVSSLTEYIKPFLLVLSNPDSRITGCERNWQKLKSALQRDVMREKLGNLSRARQSLLEVQLNMSLIMQARSKEDISSSLHQIGNSSNASNDILKQVHQLSEKIAAGTSKTHNDLDSMKAELSASSRVLRRALDVTGDMAARTSQIEGGVLALKGASTALTEPLHQVSTNNAKAVAGISRTEGITWSYDHPSS